MEGAVYLAPPLGEVVGEPGNMCRVVDVQLQHWARLRKTLHYPLGKAHTSAKAGHHDLSTLLLSNPGGMPGDRVIREHTGDDELFSVEQHLASS